MLTRFLTPCALLAALATAVPAVAQTGLPSGGAQVVIGRLFHRGPAGTVAVARFGLVVGKSGPSRVSLDVPRRDDDPSSGYSLAVSAERRRGAVRLEWSVQPAGAAGLDTVQVQELEPRPPEGKRRNQFAFADVKVHGARHWLCLGRETDASKGSVRCRDNSASHARNAMLYLQQGHILTASPAISPQCL